MSRRSNVKDPRCKKDFDQFIKEAAKKIAVVIFITKRNRSCEEIFEKLEFKAKTSLRRFKCEYICVDLDLCTDLYEYDIDVVPHFKLFISGKEVDSWEGDDALDELQERIQAQK